MKNDNSWELPDPFKKADGRRIATVDEWAEQRNYFKKILEEQFYGKMPPDRIRSARNRSSRNLSGRKKQYIKKSDYIQVRQKRWLLPYTSTDQRKRDNGSVWLFQSGTGLIRRFFKWRYSRGSQY